MAGRTILSRILGSAVILKLVACAAWLGLPVTAAAFHQDADARSVRPAVGPVGRHARTRPVTARRSPTAGGRRPEAIPRTHRGKQTRRGSPG